MTTEVVDIASITYVIETVNSQVSLVELQSTNIITEESTTVQVLDSSVFSFDITDSTVNTTIDTQVTSSPVTYVVEVPVPTTEIITEGTIINSTLEEEVTAKRTDFTADGSIIYKAEAAPGTIDSQPLWRIRQITIMPDDDIIEKYAQGSSNFSFVWSDRLTYEYI